MTDETYEERLEREIRERVEEELKRARSEMKRHRDELAREEEEHSREHRSRKKEGSGSFEVPLPDVEKVGGLLEIVADKIPVLLGGLRDLLYSPSAAENMADSVATFYKRLTEAGIPQEQALDMARGYMINLRAVLGKKGLDIGRFTDGGDDG